MNAGFPWLDAMGLGTVIDDVGSRLLLCSQRLLAVPAAKGQEGQDVPSGSTAQCWLVIDQLGDRLLQSPPMLKGT